MRKRVLILSVLFSLACGVWAKPFTVVIDAGHGGKDAGAIGRNLKIQEKNLNLDVSLRLASKIRTEYPEVNVVLTRDKDEFITLQGRADIVNKNNADLFICIHTNAAESRSAQGAETFILGTEKMDKNLDVAMRENAVMKLEADYQTTYQGFDPNSIDSYIMFELMQNQYMDQSLQFASLVQTEFADVLHRDDRGVRQAAFWVLLKSACPSVLVEMGFISNADEEKYLSSDKGKREITESLFNAFKRYYDKSGIKKTDNDSIAQPKPSLQSDINNKDILADRSDVKKVQDQKTAATEQPVAMSKKASWRVQIFVSRTKLPESDHNFKGLKGCTYKLVNGLYKYMYGNCTTKEEATQLMKQLREKFPDCFVVKVD